MDKNGRLEKLETLEKRVLRYKLKSAEDDNSVENDKDVSFTDIYKNVSQTYIYETLRYVLSNGTISGESCDSTKLYSGISDEQIRQAAERIFEFERHFKEVSLDWNISQEFDFDFCCNIYIIGKNLFFVIKFKSESILAFDSTFL